MFSKLSLSLTLVTLALSFLSTSVMTVSAAPADALGEQPVIGRSISYPILDPSLSAVRSHPVARDDKDSDKTKGRGFSLSTCVLYLS